MTLEELDKFCIKYHLHKEMVLDSSNRWMYLPNKLKYVSNQSICIAVCNNITYLNTTYVSLHFYTRCMVTETYDEACEIMESDYMPKIKKLVLMEKIKEFENQFL